jgi:hypothetical protein
MINFLDSEYQEAFCDFKNAYPNDKLIDNNTKIMQIVCQLKQKKYESAI